MKENENMQMSFGWALFCILFLLVSMVCSVLWFDIPIHVNLLLSIAVTLGVAYLNNGHKWQPLADAIDYGGKICIQPTIIMMLIGAVIGSWIVCGTVPMIIYWGLKIINPSVFLLTACFITAVVAIAIGSSWSAAGTVGVALMGIGMGLGVNPGMTAGAIVSGAYLGDKMSPMSDTTNLAPAVAEADLFDHIKSMMYTTGPAFLIALVVYALLGLNYSADSVDSEMVTATLTAIESNFSMNLLLLLPAAAVIVMAVLKCPSIPTLLVSIGIAVVLAGRLLHRQRPAGVRPAYEPGRHSVHDVDGVPGDSGHAIWGDYGKDRSAACAAGENEGTGQVHRRSDHHRYRHLHSAARRHSQPDAAHCCGRAHVHR